MGRSVEGRDRRGAGGSRTGGVGRSAAWHVRVLGGGDLAPGGYYQKVNEKSRDDVVLELQEMGGWRVRVEVRNGRAVKLHAAQADRLCYSALRAPRQRRRVTRLRRVGNVLLEAVPRWREGYATRKRLWVREGEEVSLYWGEPRHLLQRGCGKRKQRVCRTRT
jgi:hypothetical protein